MVKYGKISFAWYPLHEIMVPKNPDLTTGQKNGMHRTGYGFIHGYPMSTKVCRSAQNHWLSHVFFARFIWHPLQRILITLGGPFQNEPHFVISKPIFCGLNSDKFEAILVREHSEKRDLDAANVTAVPEQI